MSLTYGLTFFCETMLYLGGLGCLGMLQSCRAGLFWVPVLLLAAACLCGLLTGRGPWWLRYAPTAVVVPCLFLPGNRAGVLAALPMLAYLPLYVYNNRRATDYDYAVDRFRHSLIAAAFLMLLALAIQSPRWTDGLPWLFLYFSLSITLLQLLLANLLSLLFDGVSAKLPTLLRPVFDPERLFEGESIYVQDGVVTWGYVLPFFLSNYLANLYGYFMNMKTTFRGKGSRGSLAAYLLILAALILFSTWLQGWITARLTVSAFAGLGRTIAAMAAGLVQVAVLFPLEKYVLFKKE